ncbi:hypothetical protein [Streptomyces sp. ML-6]|uniref:hypothetical protein n=1 Tax=Streptomyces sp. ML-6 TaxID=2982693 RepID=UPI0024BF152E|nr:hypothetical protein [Streptomyces sp. ML-6]MDK0524847.1 hypothetical protein [Streptomyces sp. ML-6]
MISLYDVTKLAEQAAAYHHPHFQGVAKTEYNSVSFTFAAFTGLEKEPVLPREVRTDSRLSDAACDLLEEEYREARNLWYDAGYVRALTNLRPAATQAWGTFDQARTQLDEAFAALATTDDTHWHAAVSRLVTAQDQALKAARAWDEQAAALVEVNEKFLYSDLSRRDAYARAGLDTTGWVIGDSYDYRGYGERPLVRQMSAVITQQREHLQTVASLTGDRARS